MDIDAVRLFSDYFPINPAPGGPFKWPPPAANRNHPTFSFNNTRSNKTMKRNPLITWFPFRFAIVIAPLMAA